MTSLAYRRIVLRFNSAVFGMGIILLGSSQCSRAASDPDIPRLQAEAERGSIKQEVELGSAYLTGRGVAQDEKRAAYWYEKAANAGDPWAQMQIGYFYKAGIGVAHDPTQAAKWYQRAASAGLTSAKVNLGVAYMLGDGVRKDTGLAEDLFHQAFARGDGSAACYLGEMYFQGIGVQRDEAAGERWFEAGAKLHDPRSEFRIATLALQRQKDASDVKRAMKLLRESAAAGLVYAKHQLGLTLVRHPELASSPQEAQSLLKEAAEAGEWRSSLALGVLSRDGKAGMPVDPKAAYYHYRVAALQGGEEARRVVANDLDALFARLGPEQTAAIDGDAAAWFAKHHLALMFVHKDGMKWKDFPTNVAASPDKGVYAGRLILTEPLAPDMAGPGRRMTPTTR